MNISWALALVTALMACVCYGFVPPGAPSPGSTPVEASVPSTSAVAADYAISGPSGIYYRQTPVTLDTKFVSLPVDHFSNAPKTEQFLMPYIENPEFVRSGGPVYILICEKFEAEKELIRNGLLPELARETHGMLFAVGQRYSENLPGQNLEYLSTKQILHDIARFITIVKDKKELIQSKVIVAGTGATGKLAYWMKTNFNDLVDVVITDANPQAQLQDASKIRDIVYFLNKIGGNMCVKQIRDKLEHQRKLLSQPNGAEEVRKQELLCPGTNLTDKAQWYTYNAVVYSQLSKARYLDQYQANQLCNKYVQSTQVNEDFCFVLPNSSYWRGRANYLQCNEYGMFATSNGTGLIPLDLPLQWYIDTCRQNYGEKFDKEYISDAVKKTNEAYEKGKVSKVIFLSEYPGVTLKSLNGIGFPGWMQNWDDYDGVDRVKTSVKKWINYMDRRSIDKYFFFFPSQPDTAPFPMALN